MEEAPATSTASLSLGIDVGKSALELALSNGEAAIAKTSVSNDSEGHERLLSWLHDREASLGETFVCMESSGG